MDGDEIEYEPAHWVLTNPDLVDIILSSQKGAKRVKFKDYKDGNSAVVLKHFSLLQAKININQKMEFSRRAMNLAARDGELEVVQMLHKFSTAGCSEFAIDWAAERGHLEVVKFLLSNRDEGCTTNAGDRAAENGHLEVLRFLNENKEDVLTKKAMNYAAANGHLDIVDYLFNNSETCCIEDAKQWALWKGQKDVFDYLAGTNRVNSTEGKTLKRINSEPTKLRVYKEESDAISAAQIQKNLNITLERARSQLNGCRLPKY